MQLTFSNRISELKELDAAAAAGGLLVIFGRRRVGKTRMLAHWLKKRSGLYSQAIESSIEIQIEQVFRDIQDQLSTTLVPKSWAELFELLSLQKKKKWVLCLDEFPYLVASDPSLPSVLQRWLDHGQPDGSLVILAGSSTRMMKGSVSQPVCAFVWSCTQVAACGAHALRRILSGLRPETSRRPIV